MSNKTDGYDIIIEFLEILINSILYARNLYPPQIYQKRKTYGTSVYISIYPPLNDYIRNVLLSARELISKNKLHSVEILIQRENEVTVEVHKFELEATVRLFTETESDGYLIAFEQELRKTLLELDGRFKKLRKLPSTATFRIFLTTTQSGLVDLEHNSPLQEFPWINRCSQLSDFIEAKTIIPINHIKSAGIQYFVEEFL